MPDPLDPEEVQAIEDATQLLKPLVAIVEGFARERKKREWMILERDIESLSDAFADEYYWFLSQGLSRAPDQWLTEEQIVANLRDQTNDLKLHVPSIRKLTMVNVYKLVLSDLETTGFVRSRIARPKSETRRCCVQ